MQDNPRNLYDIKPGTKSLSILCSRLGRLFCLTWLLLLLGTPLTTLAKTDAQLAEEQYTQGIQFLEEGTLDSAIFYLQHAQAQYEALARMDDYSSTTTALAVCYYYQESYSQARIVLETAVQKVETSHPQFLGDFYDLLGPVYEAQGDLDRALSISFKSLDRLSGKDNFALRANLQNNIGAIYLGKGDFHHAIDYYEAAFEHYEELNDKEAMAGTLINLGLAEMRINHFEKAEDYLDRGMDLLPDNFNPQTNRMNILGFNNRALCLVEQGEPEFAFKFLQLNLDIFDPSPKETALIKANLGFCHASVGEYETAIQQLKEALELGQDLLSPNQLATAYLHLGEAQQAAHHYRESELTYTTGIQLLCKVAGIHPDSIGVNGAENANPPAVRIADKRTFFRLLSGKGRLHLSNPLQRTSQERMQPFLDAFFIMDLMRSELISPDARIFLSAYIRPFYEDAIALYTTMPTEIDFGYEVLERGKSLNLLESILNNWQHNFSNLDQESVSQLKEKQRSLDAYERALFQAEDPAQIKQFRQDILALREQLADLEKQSQSIAPLQDLRQSIRSLDRVKAYSKAHQTWVVEYGWSDRDLVEMYIGPDTVIHHILSDSATLANLKTVAFRFSRMVSDWQGVMQGGSEELDTLARDGWQLYQALLQPLSEYDATLPLVIVPEGPLHFLPFEALLSQAPSQGGGYTDLPYLIQERAISYAYSATLLSSVWNPSEEESEQQTPRCLAFAPGQGPEEGNLQALRDGEADLPGARREVKALAKVYDGSYFLGKEASKENFVQRLGSEKADILHLAMHGIVETANQEYSYLSFDEGQSTGSNDHQLYDFEIRQLDFSDTRLVVLSACETGIGTYIDGEGVLSLGRSFLQGGAESVIMSLWKLEDGASADLMGYFYQSLQAGLSRQEALRQAKLQYLGQADDLHAHPAFWAGYLLQGDTAPLNAAPSGFPWLWTLALGGLIVVFGIIVTLVLQKRRSNQTL